MNTPTNQWYKYQVGTEHTRFGQGFSSTDFRWKDDTSTRHACLSKGHIHTYLCNQIYNFAPMLCLYGGKCIQLHASSCTTESFGGSIMVVTSCLPFAPFHSCVSPNSRSSQPKGILVHSYTRINLQFSSYFKSSLTCLMGIRIDENLLHH